jgi:hypothetical protein
VWDLWWTKSHGQIFSEHFGFPANLHSTNCTTIATISHLGLASRGSSIKWTQSHPTKSDNNKKTGFETLKDYCLAEDDLSVLEVEVWWLGTSS